jgi:malonyl-CoA decarboxylase
MPATPLTSRVPRSVADLIALRAKLLRGVSRHASWALAQDRIVRSLRAHFTANPPQLRRIDADAPPGVLEQLVRCEAVHAIRDARDLSRRLQADRRCYALFSASLPDEVLAFTEIALTRGISAEVNDILDHDSPVVDPASCTCAMFYSISSCHEGLRGVTFGNSLIRQAVDRLSAELPSVRTFATVSPVPGFRAWVTELAQRGHVRLVEILAMIDEGRWLRDQAQAARLASDLLPLCASYLRHARRGSEPLDSVARFHLGNGARLERLNWLGDRSAAGIRRSVGITANYLYDLAHVDGNHLAYQTSHAVIVAPEIERLERERASMG